MIFRSDRNRRQIFWMGAFILLISFTILWGRSCELAIIKGSFYYRWAEGNRLRRIKIAAPRGRILAESGELLADNIAVYFDGDGNLLNREEALYRKAGGEEVTNILRRRYQLEEKTAHLTGYLGIVDREELGKIRCPQKNLFYQLNDWVGRSGLEEEYDCFLLGDDGEELVEVNSRGQIVREVGRVDSKPGEDLLTTIDSELQRFVHQGLDGKKAAAIVINVEDGSLFALASSPSFDPNFFNWKRNEEKIKQYLQDEEGMPFLNRAVSAAYHPGSVFKPVVAIAALAEGKINKDTVVEDVGVIKIGDWQFSNWYWNQYGRKEGQVDLIKGIKRSNDIYFYKVGEWLGAEKISEWARKFNLGEKTGIDLPGESTGLMPSPEWKKKAKGESWFLGNTYHLAIGQGDLTLTPLQVAVMTAAIANGGKVCQPHLASKTLCRQLEVKKENLELVKRGMVETCSPGGTGFPFFNFQFPGLPRRGGVGCKTGTAQLDGVDAEESHAWFTLFAPADNPKVVVTVFLERGGSGAYEAAPIAKKIIDQMVKYRYF